MLKWENPQNGLLNKVWCNTPHGNTPHGHTPHGHTPHGNTPQVITESSPIPPTQQVALCVMGAECNQSVAPLQTM